jgi:Zn-dependent protease
VFGEGSSIQLARVFGIRIGASPSWFFVLFLIIWLLSDDFQDALGGSSTEAYVVAVAAASLFFVSLLLHEIGHALAARREGIEVIGIDLWLFGGLAKLSRDSKTPGEEFRVAAAGPLVTLVIAAVCFGASALLVGADDARQLASLDAGSDAAGPLELLIAFLAAMNLLLLVFNLVPAFPLDGGRIARAIAWRFTGDRAKGTIFAAWLGQAFGVLLMGLGVYVLLTSDDAVSGIWWLVLGYLIFGSARSAAVTARVTDRLEGIRVEDVMNREPLAIPAETTVMQAHDEFFGGEKSWPWYPVVDEAGRFLGIAEQADVEQAIGTGKPALPVRELLDDGAPAGQSVKTDQPLQSAVASEPLRRLGAVMAVDADGRLRGVLTYEQVHRALTATAPTRS